MVIGSFALNTSVVLENYILPTCMHCATLMKPIKTLKLLNKAIINITSNYNLSNKIILNIFFIKFLCYPSRSMYIIV